MVDQLEKAKSYMAQALEIYKTDMLQERKDAKYAAIMTDMEREYRISTIYSNEAVPAAAMRVYRKISDLRKTLWED